MGQVRNTGLQADVGIRPYIPILPQEDGFAVLLLSKTGKTQENAEKYPGFFQKNG